MSLLQGLSNDLPSLLLAGAKRREQEQENNHRDIEPR